MSMRRRVLRVEEAIPKREKMILVGYSTDELEHKKVEYLEKHPRRANFNIHRILY